MFGFTNEKMFLLIQKSSTRRFFRILGTALIGLLIELTFCSCFGRISKTSEPNTANAPVSAIRSDGSILRNGRPFFPFGFYHDSDTSSDWFTGKNKRLQALRKVAQAGFNTIRPSLGDIDEAADIIFLNEAQKLEVAVLVGFPFKNFQGKIDVISKHKNHPAIFGWDIADDFNWPANIITPEMVRQRNLEVKSVDSNRIIYISGGSPLPNFQSYFVSADVIATQSYPIGLDMDGSGVPIQRPLRKNYDWMVMATQGSNQLHKKPIIANLQTFAWSSNRVPTEKEVRNMTYSALINDVEGIIYYTSYNAFGTQNKEWNLFENDILWNEMKSLASEIKTLSPVLLNGRFRKIDTHANDLFAARWIYNNDFYVVVVNTSETENINASITLSNQVKCLAKPLFPARPKGMIFESGQLKGTVKAEDVHVYKLSLVNQNCLIE